MQAWFCVARWRGARSSSPPPRRKSPVIVLKQIQTNAQTSFLEYWLYWLFGVLACVRDPSFRTKSSSRIFVIQYHVRCGLAGLTYTSTKFFSCRVRAGLHESVFRHTYYARLRWLYVLAVSAAHAYLLHVYTVHLLFTHTWCVLHMPALLTTMERYVETTVIFFAGK